MRKFGIGLLAISTVIVLMHNFTPHTHDTKPETATFNACSHSEEDGLLGLFQMIFHQDLGNEHLEFYVTAQIQDVDLDPSFELLVLLLRVETLELEKVSFPEGNDLIPKDRWWQTPLDLRGPPSII